MLSQPLAAQIATPAAGVKRIVILKVDGLPERLIDRYASEPAPAGEHAGHSRLPWIEHVFGENGAWLRNFYVRGISLSAPSWSLLDTGRHLEIRGNADYDRYTLRVFDYLNFFPFYLSVGLNRRADMPGVEVLDEQHIPLLLDRFPYQDRYQSFQLFQRGARLNRLESMLTVKFAHQKLTDLVDEWETGFSMTDAEGQEMEKELFENLKDPRLQYLDLYTGDYDHTAHLTNDPVAQYHVLQSLDTLVGRIWTAIQASPLASATALVMVSDHGMNTEPGVYSQGYNLIDWFNSTAGGAHHVLTNRHPMTEFKLRGLDPLVSEVISPSSESTYLSGESPHYPTCVLDLDGNERASISLRNNSLNVIQILLDQLIRRRVTGAMRKAVIDALFDTINHVRPQWQADLNRLDAAIGELQGFVAAQQALVDAQPKKFAKDERASGEDQQAAREVERLETAKAQLKSYESYLDVMRRLLTLDPADFDPGKFKMEDLVPRRSLAEPNSFGDLRHYVTGVAPNGLALNEDGTLDMERSFRHVDYFTSLMTLHVRNNVQPGVSPRPIDFLAMAVSPNDVLLWRDAGHQVLIESRSGENGHLQLRYTPISDGVKVAQNRDDFAQISAKFAPREWTPASTGMPLEYLEDPHFTIPAADRVAWLSDWHDERDWLRAVHATQYSNGIIGIVEEMLAAPNPAAKTSPFIDIARQNRRAEVIAFANDHWNFNVRGFNPGGNHGSFLRVSTHSVLMFAGGADTGVPRGLNITEPYDSLSLVPTILKLMNRPETDLPGPIIHELFGAAK